MKRYLGIHALAITTAILALWCVSIRSGASIPDDPLNIDALSYIEEVRSAPEPEEAQLASIPEPIEDEQTSSRYSLTYTERDVIERTVMEEAGGEPYRGQIAVAQCILNACEKDGIRPISALQRYGYIKLRKNPSDSVRHAVCAVFDTGETAVDAPILYFYNPRKTKRRWHETQKHIVTIGSHRFFEEVR